MPRLPSFRLRRLRSFLLPPTAGLAALSLLFASATSAQPAATGTITGRILNPGTGEYVRNAEVRIAATGQVVASEAGGGYRLSQVPPGDVAITVSYTGYVPLAATVRVAPGATIQRDFELVSTAPGSDTGLLRLDKFVVSSTRDGNAKAIMDQRNSMNISNSVASDAFGDIAEGNVGEFLKHLPGVQLDLVAGEARTVRLRGRGAEYTAVTIDGVTLASADANAGAAGDARAFSVEQVSLSSMESIEVAKTISADVDANAPAGTINLKTKRAFDRAGRRIAWQTNVTAFSENFNFDRSRGPDDGRRRKILPGGIFEYSDAFLDRRLGVVLNVSESNVYSSFYTGSTTYNYAPTAADPRPAVVTGLSFAHGPRTNERFTTTLTADFKATPNLVLSLGFIYNYADLWYFRQIATFGNGARNTVLGANPLTSFATSATNATLVSNPTGVAKLGKTYTYTPRFDYRRGDLAVDGRFAASDSKSWYDPLGEHGAIYSANSPTLTGLTYRAERSSVYSGDWRLTQTGGPDIGNGANYTRPALFTNDGRFARTQVYSGDVAATLRTNRWTPIVWKAGVKTKQEIRDFELDRESKLFSFTGPGPANWAAFKSPYDIDLSLPGAGITSASGGRMFLPNLLALGRLFRERPAEFAPAMTTTNYYNAFIANKKHYVEDISAAFAMATASVRRVILRAGLRWEDTETASREFDPRTAAEVRAAGFAVAAGRATTIPGLQYQFFSKPRVTRSGGYDHFFPSASAKYKFAPNLDLHLGYSRSIRRPTFRDIAGVWVINDETARVSAPNPNLRPEVSDNYSARLAYYFEPVGILGVNVFQNDVEGLHRSSLLTAEEFGYTGDPALAGYTFVATTSSAERVAVRGLELEYSQSLSFLPRPFKGLNVRASYTRVYAGVVTPSMAPHSASAGLSYSLGRFNVYSNLNWNDTLPLNITGQSSRRHHTNVDAGGGVRLTNRINLFTTVRNIFNVPFITLQRTAPNPALSTANEVWGTMWTFGLRGVF